MKNKKQGLIIFGLVLPGGFLLTAFFAWQTPIVQVHADQILTHMRAIVYPVGELPTPQATIRSHNEIVLTEMNDIEKAVFQENAEPTKSNPAPSSFRLASPFFDPQQDYQDWNNCGPATLALALRMWQWEGDQFVISAVIKPNRQDKNVSIEELADYVNQQTKELLAITRVGGNLILIKQLVMAGFAVVVETSFQVEKAAWPGDDLWAGHYLLVTGYDDAAGVVIVQDSYHGPDQRVGYAEFEKNWQAFNHIYLITFPTDRQRELQSILGQHWLVEENVQFSIDQMNKQIQQGQADAFAWFNLGTSYTATGEDDLAWNAFQNARSLGLPQRMLRYQFGPFEAAYRTGNTSELERLLDFALKVTPDSEEALFWNGKLLAQAGELQGALVYYRKSLEINPANQITAEAVKAILH